MKTETTDDLMLDTLAAFYALDRDERFDEYYNYYEGVIRMAVQYRWLHWIESISPTGMEAVSEAYNKLMALGYNQEEDNDDLF
jgi:bisphosphoglycerate-independent phosphoglycerate mutase (AlkP superfamily)